LSMTVPASVPPLTCEYDKREVRLRPTNKNICSAAPWFRATGSLLISSSDIVHAGRNTNIESEGKN
jgi:hypothetical protein